MKFLKKASIKKQFNNLVANLQDILKDINESFKPVISVFWYYNLRTDYEVPAINCKQLELSFENLSLHFKHYNNIQEQILTLYTEYDNILSKTFEQFNSVTDDFIGLDSMCKTMSEEIKNMRESKYIDELILIDHKINSLKKPIEEIITNKNSYFNKPISVVI